MPISWRSRRSGDVIRIDSDHAFIYAIATASRDVLPGVISMAHARGGSPDDDIGSTNRLVTTERDFEPISGMPRQSAIPVNVRPLAPAEQAGATVPQRALP